jgi:2,5-diketo-D-gluconate reductase A
MSNGKAKPVQTRTPIAYSSLVPLSTWRAAKGQDSAKTDQMKADGEEADAPFKVMARKYG